MTAPAALLRAAALGGILLLPMAPAQAQNEPVRFFNRTAQSATALYVVRSGHTAWSGNLLGRNVLAPGQFLSVRLGEGAGCRFDIRLALVDGTEVQRRDADVCATRSVDLAPQPAPAAPAVTEAPPASPAPTPQP
ncbi:hypothetical protein [Roseomonas fluvialis]|uniref:Uncharacterized protein n=1 Tax=Roseomonas fluvialis TaxID=1750527 RepID=A0ABN6P9T8_9PROT|nr:hypothetical protein [Roseomonas fluvialis]BDG74712.1 hypothetical protein Rmf_46410 [Roseomonas fluvialis]